ncbi:unnamed protein product [Pieris brassicae]|uniref:Uncharacterized protein n=1 Tax=Pieris brassicae TaxID=7116 RepID=A0A9P0TDY1_PIEBR|nr:unnamed protein product [Pieris brassicae]
MVWGKAATPANIKAGFEATGIFPFDPEKIPPEAYAPSIPTYNPSADITNSLKNNALSNQHLQSIDLNIALKDIISVSTSDGISSGGFDDDDDIPVDLRYTVFRSDRNTTISSRTKQDGGGGVCIAVHKRLEVIERLLWKSICENLWVDERHFSCIPIKLSHGRVENTFLDDITCCNLKQCNMVRNTSERTLDLVLTNSPKTVKSRGVPIQSSVLQLANITEIIFDVTKSKIFFVSSGDEKEIYRIERSRTIIRNTLDVRDIPV